jgi:uncharacterized protein (DUF433 family)
VTRVSPERELYTEAEAARLLRVPQATLHYWLEGRVRNGHHYRPILRRAPTGRTTVTWAEFIEAGLLRQYRRELDVPMPELRAFIDALRDKLGVPYPLADRRPYVGAGRELVIEAQEEAGLGPGLFLVSVTRNQLVLTEASRSFVDRVTWDGHAAVAWRPAEDPASPVRIDPTRRFGRPSVGGVSTEVLREHREAGEDVEDIATAFALEPDDVRAALAFEGSL